MTGRFQINPGPLKVVPERERKPFARPGDLDNVGRCEADLKTGAGRCIYDGKVRIDGRWLCGVHAPSAAKPERRKEPR